jgi:hypothetical protein
MQDWRLLLSVDFSEGAVRLLVEKRRRNDGKSVGRNQLKGSGAAAAMVPINQWGLVQVSDWRRLPDVSSRGPNSYISGQARNGPLHSSLLIPASSVILAARKTSLWYKSVVYADLRPKARSSVLLKSCIVRAIYRRRLKARWHR